MRKKNISSGILPPDHGISLLHRKQFGQRTISFLVEYQKNNLQKTWHSRCTVGPICTCVCIEQTGSANIMHLVLISNACYWTRQPWSATENRYTNVWDALRHHAPPKISLPCKPAFTSADSHTKWYCIPNVPLAFDRVSRRYYSTTLTSLARLKGIMKMEKVRVRKRIL